MGGERASKTRQREAGKICARCGILLGTPPAGHRPGYRTGERLCPRCEPRFPILCNVAGRTWSVHFIDADGKTRIGPWLLLSSAAGVDRILRWGHATGPEIDEHNASLRAWGCSSVTLNLTRMQRASLIARGRGWPWNGYELLQMKAAGRYPPERLTAEQERLFLKHRK